MDYGAAAVVAFVGQKLGWLDRGGAVAAFGVGGTLFAFGGWPGATLLLAFFISSSLLSRLPKLEPGLTQTDKAPRRARQVLANGAFAALFAVGLGWQGSGGPFLSWAELALAGSLAAVTADTWASEIGRFFGQTPRSAVTFRPLRPGESGGMTTAGTFAGMMGAALIGWVAYLVFPGIGAREALILEAAGALGMWMDSLLGASIQFKAECSSCGRTVEDPRHPHSLSKVRGVRFFDNDVVNFIASGAGAAFAVYLAAIWG